VNNKDNEQEKLDAHEERGSRGAWVEMLEHCCRALGYKSEEGSRAGWISERERTISTLRMACDEFGDNDWPDDLHLADVVEKHLARHLRSD